MPSRIDLSALRTRFCRRDTPGGRRLSRRAFLKASAATAASLEIGSRLFNPAARYTISQGPGWLTLHQDGNEKFRIDARIYHGRPKIWQCKDDDHLAFGIRGARFPGTNLAADLACEISTGAFGNQVVLTMESLGLVFKGYMQDWFGRDGLSSHIDRSLQIIEREELSVILRGGTATFDSLGHLSFRGDSCATVKIAGQTLACSELKIQAALPGPSLLKNGASRRTTLIASRGSANWPLEPLAGDWSYRSKDQSSIFDALEVEAHESAAQRRSYVAVSTREANRIPVALELLEPLRGTDGKSPNFLLCQIVHAQCFAERRESVTTASLARPVSLQFGSLKLVMREPDGEPALHVGEAKGRLDPRFMPNANMQGKIWEAIVVPRDTHDSWPLQVASTPNVQRTTPRAATIRASSKGPSIQGSVSLRVFRPQDLLDLTFDLRNVKLWVDSSHAIRAQKADDQQQSLMIVHLPSQTLVEQSYPSSENGDTCKAQYPAAAYLAQESRISFPLFKDSPDPIIVDLDMLLDWRRYPVNVSPMQDPGVNADMSSYTSINMPGGLSFSPVTGALFTSSGGKSIHDRNLYRLWTGRLQDSDMSEQAFVVAKAYGPQGSGYDPHGGGTQPFGLINANRDDALAQLGPDKPLPLQHLVVSTAGGWLKGHTKLFPDLTCKNNAKMDGISLNVAGGIEQLEQVSYPVFLIPTGHRASLVRTTIRQWCRDQKELDHHKLLHGTLISRYKLAFHEKTRVFDSNTYWWDKAEGYAFPFTQITIPLRETPTLDYNSAQYLENECETCADTVSQNPFWAYIQEVGGTDGSSNTNFPPTGLVLFSFPVICRDRDGIDHTSTMPMVVAAGICAFECPTYIQSLLDEYKNRTSSREAALPDFAGQSIAYASSSSKQTQNRGSRSAGSSGSTIGRAAYATAAMQMVGDTTKKPKDTKLVPWRPLMTAAALQLSGAGGFTETGGAPNGSFEYASVYITNPFDNPLDLKPQPHDNSAEIVLSVPSNQTLPALNFYAKLGGGLLQPATQIAALSRNFGNIFTGVLTMAGNALNAVSNMATNTLTILDTFGDTARLLGAIELSDIISDVEDAVGNAAAIPKLISQQLNELTSDITTVTSAITGIQNLISGLSSVTVSSNWGVLLAQVFPQMAYVRAFVSEGLPVTQYPNATAGGAPVTAQTLLSNFLKPSQPDQPNPVDDLTANLAKSLEARIQTTTALYDKPVNQCFLTLFRMRDFILNAGLAAARTTEDWYADLAAYPLDGPTGKVIVSTNVETLNNDLNLFETSVQDLLGQVTAPYKSLSTLVSNLQAAISSEDLLTIVSSLQQMSSDLTNFKTSPFATIVASKPPLAQCIYLMESKAAAAAKVANIPTATSAVVSDFQKLMAQATAAGGADTVSQAANQVNTVLTALQNQIDQGTEIFQVDVATVFSTLATTLGELDHFYNLLVSQAAALSQSIQPILDALGTPQQIRASYDYDTPLKSSGMFVASKGGTGSNLALHSAVTVTLPSIARGGQPSADVLISASISNFTLLLIPEFPFLTVGFNSASLSSTNGSTPQVHCSLDSNSVKFIGPLDFIANLVRSIGLPDGLAIQQTDTGVSLTYDLSFPAIESGLFNLTNVAFNSGIALDFEGGAIRVLFGFADPNHHFLMTYTIFGGGGYVDFAFSPLRGLSAIDINGALEFGAEAALDFGVASGDLYVFGGFLFGMTGDELDLGGYLRAGGDLNVLDLITVSVEFSMSLTYENRNGTAWLVGECDITVDVDIAWVIDTSVDIRMHREFSGSQTA